MARGGLLLRPLLVTTLLMRNLRRLWSRFLQSDFWVWRRLREARLLCRALRRDNDGLRARVAQLERERASMAQADYWYHRWDELRQRPAYFAQDAALARAYAEREQAKRELRSLRELAAGRPAQSRVDRGPESDPSADIMPKRGP